MTNEEAIAIIRNEYKCVDRDCDIERSCGKCDLMMPSKEPILEAYKLAIKALEQQPITTTNNNDPITVIYPTIFCDDAISRDMALEKMADYVASGYADSAEDFVEYSRIICQLPSVTPKPIECDDAISREDAEQMFRNIRCHLKPQDYKSAEEFNTRDLMLLNAEQMIHALPSVMHKSGKWIPVSERLPKIADVYRVTRYYPNNVMNPHYIVDACAFDGSNTWYNDNRINHERAYANNVIAWQENPEPYKGE